MQKILTAVSRTGEAVPAVGLDFMNGIHGALGGSIVIPRSGVYQVVSTRPAYISATGPAGAAPGSTYLAPGLPQHLILGLNETLRSSPVDEGGDIFVVPLKTE